MPILWASGKKAIKMGVRTNESYILIDTCYKFVLFTNNIDI